MTTPLLLRSGAWALALCIPAIVHAQIPNSGFEQWDPSATPMVPLGWATLNAVSAPGEPMNERVPGHSGAYAMRMTTRQVAGTVMAAAAVSGSFNGEGFPWSTRAASLVGKLKFHAGEEGDAGIITVSMMRRDPITGVRAFLGSGYLAWSEEATAWTDFTVPITYVNEEVPDSAVIIISSSDAAIMGVGTQLTLDDLQFQGVATGIGRDEHLHPNMRVSQRVGALVLSTELGGFRTIDLLDATGRSFVRQQAEGTTVTIDTSGIPTGVYVLSVRTADGSAWSQRVLLP